MASDDGLDGRHHHHTHDGGRVEFVQTDPDIKVVIQHLKGIDRIFDDHYKDYLTFWEKHWDYKYMQQSNLLFDNCRKLSKWLSEHDPKKPDERQGLQFFDPERARVWPMLLLEGAERAWVAGYQAIIKMFLMLEDPMNRLHATVRNQLLGQLYCCISSFKPYMGGQLCYVRGILEISHAFRQCRTLHHGLNRLIQEYGNGRTVHSEVKSQCLHRFSSRPHYVTLSLVLLEPLYGKTQVQHVPLEGFPQPDDKAWVGLHHRHVAQIESQKAARGTSASILGRKRGRESASSDGESEGLMPGFANLTMY